MDEEKRKEAVTKLALSMANAKSLKYCQLKNLSQLDDQATGATRGLTSDTATTTPVTSASVRVPWAGFNKLARIIWRILWWITTPSGDISGFYGMEPMEERSSL